MANFLFKLPLFTQYSRAGTLFCLDPVMRYSHAKSTADTYYKMTRENNIPKKATTFCRFGWSTPTLFAFIVNSSFFSKLILCHRFSMTNYVVSVFLCVVFCFCFVFGFTAPWTPSRVDMCALQVLLLLLLLSSATHPSSIWLRPVYQTRTRRLAVTMQLNQMDLLNVTAILHVFNTEACHQKKNLVCLPNVMIKTTKKWSIA